ncbi:hypothetical protein [Streptomyces hiroshimensis]|uniref:Lipoprotein n=1 Tax=Streptomyces hiroshimensis TaxID=66424 RepID=A0ABQ2YGV5_9ACTN|nr:hypothetical protein [Streptomyces hiroshimensis]GGX81742.1 lipoprotein [Streptomyces hiroshimensis]
MRRTTVRRTALAASAMSLALLVSACGSDKSEAKKDEPKGKASSSAPAQSAAGGAGALSKEQLTKLLLAEGEIADHKVSEIGASDLAMAKTMTSDKAECKPLSDVMMLQGAGSPAAAAARKIMAKPKGPAVGPDASSEEKAAAAMKGLGAVITSDTLASYAGQGATEAFAAIKKAGADCAGGFAMGGGSDKTKIKKVAPATFSAGDEAVAFTLDMEVEDGKDNTTHLVVVRKGSTIAGFYALSLTGQGEQPKAVVDAQVKKLG